MMICSNRKTRVFDPSGHETFIAHVSLIYINEFPSYLAELTAKLDLTVTQVMSKLATSRGSYPQIYVPSSTPTYL